MKIFEMAKNLIRSGRVPFLSGFLLLGCLPDTGGDSKNAKNNSSGSPPISSESSDLLSKGFLPTLFALKTPRQLDALLAVLEEASATFAQSAEAVSNPFEVLQKELGISVWSPESPRSGRELQLQLQLQLDIKLMSAALRPLRKFSGIYWRLDGLLGNVIIHDGLSRKESRKISLRNSSRKKKNLSSKSLTRALISSIVGQFSTLRLMNFDSNGSTNHSDLNRVVFDYITQPWWSGNSKEKAALSQSKKQFSTMKKFQRFLQDEILGGDDSSGAILRAVKEVSEVLEVVENNGSVYYNLDHVLNVDGFDNDFNDLRIGVPELHGILAGLHLAAHHIKVFSSVNMDKFVDFAAVVYRTATIYNDAGNRTSLEGISQQYSPFNRGFRYQDFAEILSRDEYSQLFVVKNSAMIQSAFMDLGKAAKSLQESIVLSHIFNDQMDATPFYLNPFRFVRVDHRSKDLANDGISNLLQLTTTTTTTTGRNSNFKIKNPLTGDSVSVNLRGFYHSLNGGFDMKVFVPGLSKSSTGVVYNRDFFRGIIKLHEKSSLDYRAGTVMSRKYDVYATLFPDLYKNQNEDSYKKHVQTLGFAFGTGGVAGPLALVY